jgi:NAD(P)-dependent dehydrogenase (short-subunit alcohol dehydrogenase family)
MNLTRLVLPAMRQRGNGTIVNISSTAGIEAKPSRSLYCSSKFALEAFSESLYHEMKPLGVRILLVEPGAFRTNFSGNIATGTELPKEYQGTVTELALQGVKDMGNTWKAPGDVEKGVKAIFDVVMGQGQGTGMEDILRLPLGTDGNARWDVKLDFLRKDLEATKRISEGTDYDD